MKDMSLFVEVATYKSFSQAADSLNMPVSTLSRRITLMEKDLGVRLFNRNSRTVKLTDAGSIYFDRCKFIVTEAKEAREALLHSVTSPTGTVRVSAPANFCQFMSGSLISFAKKYPTIRLHLQENENWSDLVTDRFDLEIRIGKLPDSSLIARFLTKFHLGLFSAPELFTTYEMPKHPQDLLHLPCISLRQQPHWTFIKDGVTEEVFFNPIYQFNSGHAIRNFTLAGLGISHLPLDIARNHVRQGRLIPILEDWQFPEKPVYIVMPSKKLPVRVSLFVDHLIEECALCTATTIFT